MDNNMTYEEASKRLEEIVELLDSGDAELDKSFDLFKEGVTLIKFCNDKLDKVESEVKKLVNINGEMIEENFEINE